MTLLKPPASDTTGKLQVLSLAGGGFMGLFTAEVLGGLEQRLKGTTFYETTDLFAGTSVGALIALGLAAGKRPSDIVDAMKNSGEKIFPPDTGLAGAHWLLEVALKRATKPKFSADPLKAVIVGLVGDLQMGDLKRRALVPAVDLTSGTARLFRGGIDGPDAELLVCDVALASAAAPSYFPIQDVAGGLFADGGLIANAPDVAAAVEALEPMMGRRGQVRMLAIGTTLYAAGVAKGTIERDAGLKHWAPLLIKHSMAGQVELSRQLARTLLGAEKFLLVDPIRTSEQDKVLSLDKAGGPATETLSSIASAELQRLDSAQECVEFINAWKLHKPVM